MVCKTKQNDKELNTSLNDTIFVPPGNFINVYLNKIIGSKLYLNRHCSSCYFSVFVFILCAVCPMLPLYLQCSFLLAPPFFLTLFDIYEWMRNYSFFFQNYGNCCYYKDMFLLQIDNEYIQNKNICFCPDLISKHKDNFVWLCQFLKRVYKM